MDVRVFLLVLTIILACAYMMLQKIASKNYFRKGLSQEGKWIEARLFLAFFTPTSYFKKKNFWEGYSLYALGVVLLVLSGLSFYFFIRLGVSQ